MQCYVCHFQDNVLHEDIWINHRICCKYGRECDCPYSVDNDFGLNDGVIRIRTYLSTEKISSWKNHV